MLPTPSTSHVSFDVVYEPAEDSFLLLDTLSKATEKAWLAQRVPTSTKTPVVLEVGTGSGVVIAFLVSNALEIFGRDILAFGIDVNTNACGATMTTVQRALREQRSQSVYLGSVCADLLSAIAPASVDVLIFNPPYVPTAELPGLPQRKCHFKDQHEHNSHLLELSYAGGLDGMETTWRLLKELPHVLSRQGVAYVLLCAQNRPDEVKAAIPAILQGHWTAETVGSSGKTAGWEKLVIVRIAREQPEDLTRLK